jgi:hypothetical protein
MTEMADATVLGYSRCGHEQEETMDDDQLAVLAHGLVQSAKVAADAATTLRSLLATRCLLDADAEHLLNLIDAQAGFVAAALQDVVATAPQALRDVLDDIDLRSHELFDDPPVVAGRPADPVGWQSAVAMLRSGLARANVLGGLRAQLGLTHAEAASAVEFAQVWLDEARTPDRT